MRQRLFARISLISLVFLAIPAVGQAAATCRGLTATIVGTSGNDQLRGTEGDDVIAGLGGNDTIRGEAGNDVICGGPGNDTLFGGAGSDTLYGDEDNDAIFGGDGDDTIDGGSGKNNTLHGDDGRDRCTNGKPHKCEDEGAPLPLANAGPDQSAFAGATITLDGSRSSGADTLTFLWSFVSVPAGASPVLSDPAAINPTFVATLTGEYVVQLIVKTATNESMPDTVLITVGPEPNSPPTANAGPDRSAPVGATATLDGSGSTDPDGNRLTFHWGFVSRPDGSSATLSDVHAVMPTFTIDQPGTYVVALRVNDGVVDSDPDFVTVMTTNSRPVANAGADQTSLVGRTVTLDGSLSSDVDRNALTYHWSLLNAPATSNAALSDPTAVRPTLPIDVPGSYLVQLIVNDGLVDSEPDSVVISTINSPPVANAGADQTTRVTETVTLNGGASSDVDGDPLTYRWALTATPEGSGALLMNATSVSPTFVVDRFGTYVAQLFVNDGTVDSDPDSVSIVTTNSPPVANAGSDQTAFVTNTVTLDGSASSDVDGNPLTYRWSLSSVPTGSTAMLSDPTSARPSFRIDLPGLYVAQLIVNDGRVDSAPDSVMINTQNSAPVADAGDDQSVFVGTTVTLDGSRSMDVDRDPLTFRWSLITSPTGSNATLMNATSQTSRFTVDLPGMYVAQLIVNDGTVDSAPDTVTVTTMNSAPVADASPDQESFLQQTVMLDGSASRDADRDPLTYHWSFTSIPAGSAAMLSDAAALKPTFTPDVRGIYIAQLIVNDGSVDSAPDTVAITTKNSAPVANAGADQTPFVTETVMLDGRSSSDIDGDTLTFHWTLTVPAGSNAMLSDPTSATPTFVVDRPGTYAATLIVNDGSIDSAADTAIITTQNSAPFANAGDDQTVLRGTMVTLSGSGSDVDLQTLSFRWSFTARPAGSNAALSNPSAQSPTFVADAHGTYELQLMVNDGFVDSAPDAVVITTQNRAPIATVGDDQTVESGETVTLTGSGFDPDGDAVTLHWTLTVPAGSSATLSNPNVAMPTFVADRAGEFIARLVVNDGQTDSTPAFVSVIVLPQQIDLNLLGTPFLGVGRSAQLQVVLPQPAPAGGVTVTVTSDTASILSVSAPGTVFIAAGDVTGIVTANGVAPGPAILRANAPGYNEGTATLTVTDKLVNLPDAFSVPLGAQANLLVSISPNPAPAGGTVIQLTTSDENVIAVSASVTILPGEFSANAIVTGVRPGSAIVTATNPDFATDTSLVSTAAQLNITVTSVAFNAGFQGNITIQLQSSGAVVPAPSPGVQVSITSANPACAVAVTSTLNIATGLSTVTSAVAYGGTATLPCTTTLTASSPGVASDTVSVTVNPKPTISVVPDLPTTIGSGQMSGNLRAFLSIANHGGATVTLASNNPNVLLSPNVSTVGTQSISITLPNNSSQVNFIAHALEGTVGSATITVSEPRFTSTTGTVTVVQPAIALNGLATPIDTLAPNRNFVILYGIQSGTSVAQRNVRAGGTTLNVTVTSSNPTAGDLIFGGVTAGTVTVQIAAGNSQSGTIQFHPKAVGQTTITCSATGVVATPAATFAITVTTPSISLATDLPTTVGSGQMSGNLRAFLSAGNHGGATIKIESNNANVLVSPNVSTVGTQSVLITIPTNTIQVNFIVHALEGFVGSATITASEPRFTSGSGGVTVVQPAIALNGLATPIDTLAPNRNFTVLYGIPAGTSVSQRSIRAGGSTVNVTVTSSNPAAGDLVFGGTTAGTIIAPIFAGNSQPATIQFHPKTAGQTTITCSASGVATTPAATFTITVTTPSISLATDLPTTIGSGQMSGNLRAFLSAANHGGATIRIESNNANVLVSPNVNTVGTQFILITVPNNTSQINFIAHALEGFVGSATITASEPRYSSGSGGVTVVQPAIALNSLANGMTIDTLDPNRNFNVLYGIPSGTSVSTRNIRAGGTTVNVTVTSSNAGVGELVFGGVTAASVTVPLTAGNAVSPNIQFHPVMAGQTTVTIAASGVITTPAGSATITVTTPTISLSPDLPLTVGAGLQSTNRRAFLGAGNHGGVIVRIESSNSAIALVSPNVTTPGSTFILVNVPNGQTQVNFVVQGVLGADGSVVITVSVPRFSDGQGTARVVPAAVRIAGLNTTATAGGADDVFSVQIGIPNADGSNLAEQQNVRGGGVVMVTLTSDTPAVAAFVSGSTTVGSLTVPIGANQSQSANVSLRPLSVGSTLITAAAPNGVITTGAGRVSVTVN